MTSRLLGGALLLRAQCFETLVRLRFAQQSALVVSWKVATIICIAEMRCLTGLVYLSLPCADHPPSRSRSCFWLPKAPVADGKKFLTLCDVQ